jgi:uncharacterized protein YbaR (Trm112 family)
LAGFFSILSQRLDNTIIRNLTVPLKKELLAILCCPVTKAPVEILPADKLALVNDQIARGRIKNVDGSVTDQPIEEALITGDKKTIYRIDEGIPVMLADLGIPTDQLENL